MTANVKGCAISTIVMCALLILGCFLREYVHLKQRDDFKPLVLPKSKSSHGILHRVVEFYKHHTSTIFLFLSVLCTAAVMGILIRYLTVYRKNKTLPNVQNYTTMKNLRKSLKWLSGLNIVFILFFAMSSMTMMNQQHKKTFIHWFIHHLSSILIIFAVVIFILCLCIPQPSMVSSPLPSLTLPLSASPSLQPLSDSVSPSFKPLFFFPPSISPISLPPISSDPSPYQPILTAPPTYF